MLSAEQQQIVELTHKLLVSIAEADWKTYEELCDPTLTCVEPEVKGQVVEGLDFHRFYFQFGAARKGHHTTIASPHVRIMGDVAVIAYARLNQRVGADGGPSESAVAETRVWQRKNGRWQHVHFHRSPF